jgi:hypothetical protein
MLVDVVESLMKGERLYPEAFAVAQGFWDSFYREHYHDNDEALQEAVDDAQLPFQWEVEKVGLVAPLAKSIMPITALGALYRDGFDDESFARRLLQRFVDSTSLSLGVKSAAQVAAKMYGLE